MVSKIVLCALAAFALVSVTSATFSDFSPCVSAMHTVNENLGLGLNLNNILGGALSLVGSVVGGAVDIVGSILGGGQVAAPTNLDSGLEIVVKALLMLDLGMNKQFGSAYNKHYLSQLFAHYIREACGNNNGIDLSKSCYQADDDFDYATYYQGLKSFQPTQYASYYQPLINVNLQILNILGVHLNADFGNLGKILSLCINAWLGSSKIFGYNEADAACSAAQQAFSPLLAGLGLNLDSGLMDISQYKTCQPCIANSQTSATSPLRTV